MLPPAEVGVAAAQEEATSEDTLWLWPMPRRQRSLLNRNAPPLASNSLALELRRMLLLRTSPRLRPRLTRLSLKALPLVADVEADMDAARAWPLVPTVVAVVAAAEDEVVPRVDVVMAAPLRATLTGTGATKRSRARISLDKVNSLSSPVTAPEVPSTSSPFRRLELSSTLDSPR